jgi:hypothetical protein
VSDPFDVNWKSNHPCSITFFDNSSFSEQTQQAVNAWNGAKCSDNLSHVHFMGAFMLPDITIVNTCIQDASISGSTTKNDDGTFTIALNVFILDGFLTNPRDSCTSDYPRDPGYVQTVIAHELGHTIGLDHNLTGGSGALMVEGLRDVHFVCGTSAPTSAEMTPICAQYPNPCH